MAAPTLGEYLASLDAVAPGEGGIPFDRMMFDVCGEANHVRAAATRAGGDVAGPLRALGRACGRVYADPDVSPQRKFSLRTAEWLLRSWCEWGDPRITERSALRWFDAWQRERNMALLRL